MSRDQREPQQHIHAELVDEANDMSIRIKLAMVKPTEHMAPPPEEVAALLDRLCIGMNQCTKPYKVH